MSLRLGTRVGDYEVIGMLGSGGMGAVYQVRHLISDRIEAMKVLLPDLTSTPELAERFVREIRLQASLSHPNIASLHNALHVENQLLMVMEYVDGETLADILRRGPLSQRRAVDTGIQILAALDYAHSRGVVHRDIKPSNVIINSEGLAKLMDFGIARGIDDLDQLTQAGSAVGSMYYMSPEQVRAEAVDGRSDVYATGVTLFEAMTGERPIKGKTAAEVLQAQLEHVPRSPSLINPAIAESVSRIVLKALEKDPHWRYQSAGAFRADLVEVLPALPVPPEGRTPPPPLGGKSRPYRLILSRRRDPDRESYPLPHRRPSASTPSDLKDFAKIWRSTSAPWHGFLWTVRQNALEAGRNCTRNSLPRYRPERNATGSWQAAREASAAPLFECPTDRPGSTCASRAPDFDAYG